MNVAESVYKMTDWDKINADKEKGFEFGQAWNYAIAKLNYNSDSTPIDTDFRQLFEKEVQEGLQVIRGLKSQASKPKPKPKTLELVTKKETYN